MLTGEELDLRAELAARTRHARQAAGLTRAELALELGLTARLIMRTETATGPIEPELLEWVREAETEAGGADVVRVAARQVRLDAEAEVASRPEAGRRILKARTAAGLSLAKLGKMLGLRSGALSQMERGLCRIKPEVLAWVEEQETEEEGRTDRQCFGISC